MLMSALSLTLSVGLIDNSDYNLQFHYLMEKQSTGTYFTILFLKNTSNAFK